jgi:hypothetical protein
MGVFRAYLCDEVNERMLSLSVSTAEHSAR